MPRLPLGATRFNIDAPPEPPAAEPEPEPEGRLLHFVGPAVGLLGTACGLLIGAEALDVSPWDTTADAERVTCPECKEALA